MENVKHRSRRDDAAKKEIYKGIDKEKGKERNGEKHMERARDRETDNGEELSRRSDKHKESRQRDSRVREKESSSSKHRDEKQKIKERERDERERDRDLGRFRKRREAEKARHSDPEDERDRKRLKREGSVRERARERDRDRDREMHEDSNRHRDDDDGRRRTRRDRHKEEKEEDDLKSRKNKKKNEENDVEKNMVKEDTEEEQRRLDEEMEKRRRRVQEWQELRRKKVENESKKSGEEKNDGQEPKSGKKWTLEGEESDEDEGRVIGNDGSPSASDTSDSEGKNKNTKNGDAMELDNPEGNGEEEIDPLDAFMSALVVPKAGNTSSTTERALQGTGKDEKDVNFKMDTKQQMKNTLGRIIPGEDSDEDYEDNQEDENPVDDEDDDEFVKRMKKTKVDKLSVVDHSKIKYPPFRKNFYREVREMSQRTAEEVAVHRKELELKIRGKDVPKPVKTWNQTGLTRKMLESLKKLGFEKPMSIQAQALPIIMSGRDCIGIAKTGSGKTLAFVLPMLRHINDQPPLAQGDGPIGLIMAPTRELVQQIQSDIKKFAKVLGLNCVPVHGGSGVAQQISELKRGTEIVVCTPGRMIDVLCTSGGKITNLSRVTYLVMDEADRMFDMGFEPQITRIVQNTRPDRQTVLFSATFPRQVEVLARKVLNKPIEIQVGGRSVVNKDIAQYIEVRPENDRLLRLLELLGEWYEKGKVLVFVHSQEKCDNLFKELIRHGYPCLSLHGAKDQTDRESTISDFKSNVCNLLIATSIAARGLDVKELELVVNFDAPNHYEDYVHRVGRTGRAGHKGVAITFISDEAERYAPDLVKALELSEQPIPEDLKKLADGFMAKVSQGTEHAHGTGYGGSGFKFNEEEEEARKAAKKAQAREYGFDEYDKSDSDSDDEGIRKAGGDIAQAAALAQAAAMAAATKGTIASLSMSLPNSGALGTAPTNIFSGETLLGATPSISGATLPINGLPGSLPVPNDAAARAQALAAAMNLQHNLAKIQKDAMPEHYEAELEINDFPQNARWKVTHKETLGPISDWTGAAITTRGQYYPPGKIPGPGERKLYLFIEGPTESSVKKGKAEVKRVLEDYTGQAISLPGAVQPGKYSVL